jgi:hypothetical protein
VVRDLDLPSGYRIVDDDEDVADTVFLTRLDRHMRLPVLYQTAEMKDGRLIETMEQVGADHPQHFDVAIRTVPDAPFGPARGKR